MTLLRVRAAIVDVKQLTLYLEDGTKHTIPQGDPALQDIVDAVIPLVTKGAIAEINTADYVKNAYADYAEKSGGVVKMYRIAKKFVSDIFKSKAEKEADAAKQSASLKLGSGGISIEAMATANAAVEPTGNTGGITEEKAKAAVSDIMSKAEPIKKGDTVETKEEETVIAVVDGKVIPGMEKLKGQFEHFAKSNSKGLENFLKRIATVIDDRGHSVEDLLRFMEKGDLPLADDGSIIAYKILRNDRSRGKGYYLDCHSGKVSQRVGSYVVVDLSLVDTNRRNECSNGLHIARRGYLGNFYGDICVLTKLAPEDVVTVPHGDPNKVRVMGYHILGELSNDDFRKLKANQHMTDGTEAAKLLTAAMRGDHIGKVEEVRITEQRGGGLKIKALMEGFERSETKAKSSNETKAKTAATAAEDAVALDSKKAVNKADVKAISSTVAAKKATASSSSSKKDKVIALIADLKSAKDEKSATPIFNEINRLKKEAKTGWEKLGTTQIEIDSLNPTKTFAAAKSTPAKASKKPASAKEPEVGKPVVEPSSSGKKETKKKVKTSTKSSSTSRTGTGPSKAKPDASSRATKASSKSIPKTTSAAKVSNDKPKKLTTKEEARQLFDKKSWAELKKLKASAKVSWFKLGFSAKEEAEILKH